jgi:hypothetical protein
MRQRGLAVAAVAALLGGAAVGHGAEPVPDLVGTWTGSGPGVGKEESWTDESVTLTVTEQRGPVFTGRKVYADGEEAIYGTVRADGRTLLVADDGDGQAVATILGPDSLEYCYLESGADAQVHCRVLARSR